MLDKDTTLCLSISARPSNFGTRFHNFLYREMGLNFVYKACSVDDLGGAVRGIRALKVRGSAVSMPFKERVIPLLDDLDPAAAAVGAVNTIVNTEGRLRGHNTDTLAVYELLGRVPPSSRTALLGSGGMARAVAYALHGRGFRDVTVIARNAEMGRSLADRYGFRWQPAESGHHAFLINATPIGMSPDPPDRLPLSPGAIAAAASVMDCVANPSETALVRAARAAGASVITGFDVIVLQAVEQFRLYTGVVPPRDLALRAAEHART